MAEFVADAPVRSRSTGAITIIYAGNYLNKLSGERVERECRDQLETGCRALVLNFRDTELVNSIGVSILLGVIDAAEQSGARLIFSNVRRDTVKLFEILGLMRCVALAESEEAALATLTEFSSPATASGH